MSSENSKKIPFPFFQPVNEDKYLCYSCNNWLINWHSLRNLNKDPVESQSDKSRSRLHESMPQGADRVSISSSANRNQKPAQPNEEFDDNLHRNKKRNGFYFPKRPLLTSLRIGKIKDKSRTCSICGRSIRKRPRKTSKMQKPVRSKMRCKRCMRLGTDNLHLRRTSSSISRNAHHLYNIVNFSRNPLPALDRSLVARLQRLGTTLRWESEPYNGITRSETSFRIHRTESKVKYDTWGEKVNERDEVLIDFNRVLSEVFPLNYHRKGSELNEMEDTAGHRSYGGGRVGVENEELLLEALGCKLPQGVTISLVNEERQIN